MIHKRSWAGAGRVQRGAAMLEFVFAGSLISLIGTVALQYVLMFNAKNIVNHAGFMAARAGAMHHAQLSDIQDAYHRALIPLYGGGRNTQELAQALAKAVADTAGHVRLEILNPTRESFEDWSDSALSQAKYDGRRAIPNANLGLRSRHTVKSKSGQNLQDANVLKLKITHGYALKVPLASTVTQFLLKWADDGKDPFISGLYAQRRIPLVTHVTVQMQSDGVESANLISIPGQGNGGHPIDPGFLEPPGKAPPECVTVGCTTIVDPSIPPGSGGENPPLLECPPGDINCTPLDEDGPVCSVP